MEEKISKIGFFTYNMMHNKEVGSSRIRVHNLIKYWPESELYKSGVKYDVMIFQKAYWKEFAQAYKGIKILDICDPDWMSSGEIREFVDLMDGIVCNSEEMAKFMRQFGKPVKVIDDRHDLEEMKGFKQHKGPAKMALWFGYSHNFRTMTDARVMMHLQRLGLKLKIISNQKVSLCQNFTDREFEKNEKFVKWNESIERNNWEMLEADFALLPKSIHLQDRFKSNNKDTYAWLLGLPVAKTLDDLIKFMDADEREKEGKERREFARKNYDCKSSVKEYKEFIDEISKKII